jgi:phage-related protein
MGAERVLQIVIKAKDQATEALEKVSGRLSGSLSRVREAMGAVGLMAAGYLKGAIESAAKAEQSNARLKNLVENQGLSWDKAKGKVDDFSKGILKMSTYSGGQAKEALTILEQKGVKFNAALGMQNTLVNLAAGKNIELSAASDILADAYNGKTKALVGLGLATKEEIKHGISFDEVQKRINERFSGAAAAQLNTYAGQMQQFHNNLASLKSTIGSYILPYFLQVSKHLNEMSQKLNGMDPSTKKMIANVLALTAVFGTLTGGVGLVQKIMGVFGPVVSGLGAAIGGLTWPILLIIAAIALLTAAWVKDWGGIREKTMPIIMAIKNYIVTAFTAVVAWIKQNWPQIKATFEAVLLALVAAYNTYLKPVLKFIVQEFGIVIAWVKQNMPLISGTITIILNTIRSIITAVLSWIVAFWQAHGNTIMAVVRVIWDIIKTVIGTAINVVLGVIRTVMQIINGDWSGAWHTIVNTVKSIFGGIGRIIWDILSGIGTIFADIAKTAIQWGENLIKGFIDGITNKLNAIKDIAKKVTGEVAKFLGFNSPAKEGEGRNITVWGQNMIKGFMDGINSQLPGLKTLMNSAIKAPPLHSNVLMGASGANRVTHYNSSDKVHSSQRDGEKVTHNGKNDDRPLEIKLYLDGKQIARYLRDSSINGGRSLGVT